jgi:hypothetical protein
MGATYSTGAGGTFLDMYGPAAWSACGSQSRSASAICRLCSPDQLMKTFTAEQVPKSSGSDCYQSSFGVSVDGSSSGKRCSIYSSICRTISSGNGP